MDGLNWYDYSARHYDPAIARFSSIDPMAEKYYSISPYAYVNNNPLKYIDKDGKWIDYPPVFGSQQDIQRHAVNQEQHKLSVHAAIPAAFSFSKTLSIPFNLIHTLVVGLETVYINKGPEAGTVAIYGTIGKAKGLADIGGSESVNIYHLQGDERLLNKKSFEGESQENSYSGTMGGMDIGVNKSKADVEGVGRIEGNGLSLGKGLSSPITGKKTEKNAYLLWSFSVHDNNNEKYNESENYKQYYIRRYTNLKELQYNVKGSH